MNQGFRVIMSVGGRMAAARVLGQHTRFMSSLTTASGTGCHATGLVGMGQGSRVPVVASPMVSSNWLVASGSVNNSSVELLQQSRQQQQQQQQSGGEGGSNGRSRLLGRALLALGAKGFCSGAMNVLDASSSSDDDDEEEVDANIAPWAQEKDDRTNEETIDEDWIDRNEPDMFENMQSSLFYKSRRKHLKKVLNEEDYEDMIGNSFKLAEDLVEPEEETEEPEAVHQEEIERFLKQFGEDDHADKFPSWSALMSYDSRKLKQLEVPMKSRKTIRKYVELYKQSMVFRGLSPAYPPWERVTLEQARDLHYEQDVARITARVEARRVARLKQANLLREHLEQERQHNESPLMPFEMRQRALRDLARGSDDPAFQVFAEEEYEKIERQNQAEDERNARHEG